MLSVAVLALIGCSGQTERDTEADTDADTTAPLPLITEASLCETPERPGMTVSPGTDLVKVTLSDPLAVCNDGSPGVIYISPPPQDSPDADKWVIWLEGGGGCHDAAACADRWCSVGGVTATPAKMSSTWTPDGVQGHGIFDRSTANPFRGYTHVMAYYCSSDNWSGTTYTELVDDSETYPSYGLYLHGAHLIDGMIDALKAGASSDDGGVTLSSLDDAEQVLFMGTSAGAGGVRYNGDRVAADLRQTNDDVDVRIVVDAGFDPKEADPPELTQAQSDAFIDFAHEVNTTIRAARVDASCVAFHADDPAICADSTHTLVHHIETPWYVKMDVTDTSASPGLYPDNRSFSAATLRLLSSLDSRPDFAEEYPDYVPAVFAPNCGHHANLEVDDFRRIQLTGNGTRISNADHLYAWATDDLDQRVLIHEAGGEWTSDCDGP